MGENKKEDVVNHPSHYTFGKIEVIDMIDSAGWLPEFCAGNAIKYIMRHQHKGKKIEDLKKARWYLDKLIEAYEKEDKQSPPVISNPTPITPTPVSPPVAPCPPPIDIIDPAPSWWKEGPVCNLGCDIAEDENGFVHYVFPEDGIVNIKTALTEAGLKH